MEPVYTDGIGSDEEATWREVQSAAKALCDASPSTVIAEDLSGASALEYAITTSSSWNVIGYLMKRTKQQRLTQVKEEQEKWRFPVKAMNPKSSIKFATAA